MLSATHQHSRFRVLGAALAAGGAVALAALDRRRSGRNVTALANHVGCSDDVAWRLYRLARRDGYGSAYREVFAGKDVPTHAASLTARP